MARIYYPTCDPETDQEKKREFRLDQLTAIHRIANEIDPNNPHASMAALVGAGMGSGKTAISVEVILHTRPQRCLIVGVRDAYVQWAEALEDQQHEWNVGPLGIKRKLMRIDGTTDGAKNLAWLLDGKPGLFYVGLEMLRAKDWETHTTVQEIPEAMKRVLGAFAPAKIVTKEQVQKHTYSAMAPVDLLISDESHKHSNRKSAGLDTVRTIPARAKMALSGTFFGNRFDNAWSIATWLWGKGTVGTRGAFEKEFCVKVKVVGKDGNQIKRNGRGLTKITGERFPGTYVDTLPCYVYVASPLGNPPDPEIVKYDLHPEQQRQYDEMLDQSLTWIPSISSTGREPLVADLDITQRIRLRTAALGGMTLVPGKAPDDPDSITFEPGCKTEALNAAYKVLHRQSWVGKKVLILTHSKPFAIETARRIGTKYTVALKTGDTKDWQELRRRFMLPVSETDSIQYLVAVISAVGTATDGLQMNCSRVLWISEDENNVNNIQGSNRVWRYGVDVEEYESVKLVARGTIAEGIMKKNLKHKSTVLGSVQVAT